MPYDLSNCQSCPYLNQVHLPSELRTTRPEPPVELERNSSRTLIVGEALGIEEWHEGAPFQAVKKVGGTAGSRLEQSWGRVGKCREDFDLLNTVQCYPGQKGKRDARPHPLALSACTGKLASVLTEHRYEGSNTLTQVIMGANGRTLENDESGKFIQNSHLKQASFIDS